MMEEGSVLIETTKSAYPIVTGTGWRFGLFHSTYNTSDYVTHVGIYVGSNQMYHAGNPIGYTDLTAAYWQQHIICAGRIKK